MEGGRSRSASQHPSDKDSDKEWMGSKRKSKSSSKSHGKMASKSKCGTPAKGQESEQARPSHDHWPVLPTPRPARTSNYWNKAWSAITVTEKSLGKNGMPTVHAADGQAASAIVVLARCT